MTTDAPARVPSFRPHGDLPKSASRDHPSLECLLGGGGHDACFRCTRYVGERAINGRERHAVAHGPLVFSQRRVVDDDAPTPPAEGPGNGDVDLGGHGVGQSVDGKGGVVGGRAALASPQAGHDHVLERLRGMPGESVDAVFDPGQVAGFDPIGEWSAGDAEPLRLGGGEVAALGGSETV